MTDGQRFDNISIVGRRGKSPGKMRIYQEGIVWRKQGGGGKAVEIDKDDMVELIWMKVPRTTQLTVRSKDGIYVNFVGFRDQDVATSTTYFQTTFGITPVEKQLSVSGRNWGEIEQKDDKLAFNDGSKKAFEIHLPDVHRVKNKGKNDLTLEFKDDDTETDSLKEMSFYVPSSNPQFVSDENLTPSQVFYYRIMPWIADNNDDHALVTFDGITILTPRGRCNVELHLSFLRLQGQANDFKIPYDSVVWLFLLPKSNEPHTFVVISLDPPIGKGKTFYPQIVLQFETDYVFERKLCIDEDLLNIRYKDKLEPSYKGPIHEVFTTILRGLSGAKVTKPGMFRSAYDNYAVNSSLKLEDGILYPLERSFFFLPKPPTVILHEEIEYLEFQRHATGTSYMHYFDLLMRLDTPQQYLFCNIQNNEYQNLFDYISRKGLKIRNLGEASTTDVAAGVLQDELNDAVDPHLELIKNEGGGNETDEEDEDFVGDKDDGGSPTDDPSEGDTVI